MSDPQMAQAMERDIRNRFFVALALTIPTILFSPMAMQLFGIELVPMSVANWLALAFSTPVVWWAGWIFISGSLSRAAESQAGHVGADRDRRARGLGFERATSP